MDYHFDTVRDILLDSFRRLKVLARKRVHAIAVQNGYEPATFEREIRHMVHEVGLIPLNMFGKRAGENEKIIAWRYSPQHKMNSIIKKLWKKKKVLTAA